MNTALLRIFRAMGRVAMLGATAVCSFAHLTGDGAHDAADRRIVREFRPVQLSLHLPPLLAQLGAASGAELPAAAAFGKFAPAVRVRADADFLYVESNGLPAHTMMVGITAWQQQVPLPQPYRGANAWRIPIRPVPAPDGGVTIRNHFLRGAIALAANGIPIFNPQNNRGEVSQEIGELDQWGGHCGRADDYHYHVAPLHLQAVLGKALPVAYALDGYPIHGLTEADDSAPKGLDRWNGHDHAPLGYHSHASLTYPYLNGGCRGVGTEREG
ncbi:MAG: YHYH protein, partial [Opitutaceae bacterium]